MNGIVIDKPAGIEIFRLRSLIGRIRMESVGMKSRGGSTRTIVAKQLGLRPRIPHLDLIKILEEKIEELRNSEEDLGIHTL